MKQLLSFVIPRYHSAETLPAVVEDIRRTVEADGRYDFEVILANDNPPDETWQVIQQLAAADRWVKGLCMIRNFGQHAALMAGYRASRGDIIISLDDDGQTPPDQVFKLVDALDTFVRHRRNAPGRYAGRHCRADRHVAGEGFVQAASGPADR